MRRWVKSVEKDGAIYGVEQGAEAVNMVFGEHVGWPADLTPLIPTSTVSGEVSF